MEFIVFLDMDGVIADFNGRFKQFSGGTSFEEYKAMNMKPKVWDLIKDGGVEYWSEMSPLPDYDKLVSYLINNFIDVRILSAIFTTSGKIGKKLWVKKHNIPINEADIIIVNKGTEKAQYATPNSILIDDTERNIKDWEANGGIGILHTSVGNTLKMMEKYI